MKMQILVPHWQEDIYGIAPLLNSITMQQGISMDDIGVIIAHDGPDAAKLDFPVKYPFKIEQVSLPEKMGVSAARNLALDNATADYVMFCDSDDMFINMLALYTIQYMAKEGDFDVMRSVFLEEEWREEGVVFTKHEDDMTFVHGKVYRREYLIENDIRFNPELTVHEDSYFVTLALEFATVNVKCDEVLYLWKCNPKSISRTDPHYMPHTYCNLMDSFDAIADKMIERGREYRAAEFSWYTMLFSWHWLTRPFWKGCDEDKARAEMRVARILEKYREMWRKVPDERKVALDAGVPKLENEKLPDFAEWYASIENLL